MQQLDEIYLELIIFVPLGLFVMLLLIVRGPLRRGSLAMAPRRQVKLHMVDLLTAMLVMAGGALVMSLAVMQLPQGSGPGHYALRQLLGQAAFVPPIVLVLWRVMAQRDGLTAFGLVSLHPWRDVAAGVLALLAAGPMVMGVAVLMAAASMLWVEKPPLAQHEMLRVVMEAGGGSWPVWTMLVSAVVIAPLVEEVIYRGLVQTALLNLGGVQKRWSVVLISACWFTLIHTSVSWQGLAGLFVLAMVLAWLYERHRSLWPGIVLHMGFNAVNFLWVMVAPLAP